jgi:hypothetical protein
MNIFRKIRTIAALLTIIAAFMASGTCAEASVPKDRYNIRACTQEEDYISIKCYGRTTIRKGEEIDISYSCSTGLAGEPVVWSVSDGNIATISNGHLRGNRAGVVRVTASCGRYSSYCYIEILE